MRVCASMCVYVCLFVCVCVLVCARIVSERVLFGICPHLISHMSLSVSLPCFYTNINTHTHIYIQTHTHTHLQCSELRALWLEGLGENHKNNLPHIGLDCWSPTININR